jgi:TatD DNase family protein
MILVDSHCHIDGEQFDADREQVIENARLAGVTAMFNIGTGSPKEDSFEKTDKLTKDYEFIYGSVGIHPHDASEYDEIVENRLVNLIENNPKLIAWGEIGLDFYYDHSPRDVQEKVFRRQINVARELDLPIIIHSRDADDETVQILIEECSRTVVSGQWSVDSKAEKQFRGGIMHCFGGTPEMAKALMDIGFMISFAGNVTFKKAENLRDSARVVPLDKLLIETDCPYLTPVPFRGKRNEPSFVQHTATFLADFYGIDAEELALQTTQNFEKFFKLKIKN